MKRGIHIKKGRRGWLWNLVAGNGQIVAHGEEYASKANAKRSFMAALKLFRAFDNGKLPFHPYVPAACDDLNFAPPKGYNK